LSREKSKKYGHIMDSVFDQIQGGKFNKRKKGDNNINNISLNDKYTQGMYGLMKKNKEEQSFGDGYLLTTKGNRQRKTYVN